MKKFDFVIVYEVKNREFESACLLKYELERRGYSVHVVETWWNEHYYSELVYADVMITFALYSDDQMRFTLHYARGVKRIINMFWEQVFTNAQEDAKDSPHRIRENAADQYHVVWGQHSVDRLIRTSGIRKDKMIPAGHIAMDFTKPALASYYLDRDELCDKYNINRSKRIVLFLSSFSYVGLSQVILDAPEYETESFSGSRFQRLSVASQEKMLEWFRGIALNHPESEFIYRPHPAEGSNPKLLQMQDEIKNFRVINELAVKQWIVTADVVYSWYSTSVADAYFCGKSVGILRPIEIPHDMEVTTLNGCRMIKTFDEFEKSLNDGIDFDEVLHKTMKEYYFYDRNQYSYKIICDQAESLLGEIRSQTDCTALEESYPRRFPRIVYRLAKPMLVLLARMSQSKTGRTILNVLPERIRERAEYEKYVEEMIGKNAFSETELKTCVERIAEIIRRNTEQVQ